MNKEQTAARLAQSLRMLIDADVEAWPALEEIATDQERSDFTCKLSEARVILRRLRDRATE